MMIAKISLLYNSFFNFYQLRIAFSVFSGILKLHYVNSTHMHLLKEFLYDKIYRSGRASALR